MALLDISLAAWLVSLGLLYYIYHGYLLVLRLAVWATRAPMPSPSSAQLPSLTLLLTVHNEERRIAQSLETLLALDYDRNRIEVLVASDGSVDRTNEIVRALAMNAPIRLLTYERLGKSEVQNCAIREARGDIVAFIDADCIPEKNCLRMLALPFADRRVGCVTGHLRIAGSGGVAREQGYYWNYELKLRAAESRLGILAVASGSAMAVRRSAFVPLPPDVGEDCMIPLDIVRQELKVVHASAALATDSMASDPADEFRARVRMTLRNWTGTWRHAALLNPFRNPGYAFALWSHKILRWLSPIFLLILAVSSLGLIGHSLLWPLPLLTFLFFVSAAIGWIDQTNGIGLPAVGFAYGFCLANLGFLVGVAKALLGRSIVSYGKSK